MHLAYPARKSSNPPPYANRSSKFSMLRRSRVQVIAVGAFIVGALIFILSKIFGGSEGIPSGTPPVVIVTVLDPGHYNAAYITNVKDNRMEYARRHGYTTFFPTVTDYELNGAPKTWSRVPAVRHALTKFPHSTYMWFLDQNSLIMNPEITVEDIMEPKNLETIMIKDQPVVPPDSVIKTFSHLKAKFIDLVLTQDKEGLAQGSFIIRKGDWARFFLDTWFDPLYRSYNFQRADTHALEHIVQWHPTILSKLAIIPQRTINAYHKAELASKDGGYKDGDFVIRFAGCDQTSVAGGDCVEEAEKYSLQWKTDFHQR